MKRRVKRELKRMGREVLAQVITAALRTLSNGIRRLLGRPVKRKPSPIDDGQADG